MRRATLVFAKSMNSSTRLLVSRISFCSTSIGADDSALSRWIRTSGLARFRAPASIRPLRSLMAMSFSRRMLSVMASFNDRSSLRFWASSYVNAALLAMTDLKNRTFTTSALGVSSHTVLKARRSTNGRSEHKFVPRRWGSMSMRRSTRYTVVPRDAASASIGVSGRTKNDTSAMCTPASMLPFGRRLACNASSMSWHPGGSILHIFSARISTRSRQMASDRASCSPFGGTVQWSPSDGKHAKMDLLNGRYGTSNSKSRLSCSASLLSIAPSERTK